MSEKWCAYVGNWGFRGSDDGYGISIYTYENGKLNFIERCEKELSIGNLCLDDEKKILYCVDEKMNLSGVSASEAGGRVLALKINEKDGKLSVFDSCQTYAPLPSYCCLSGENLIVTNHSGGGPVSIVSYQDGEYSLELRCSDAPTVLYKLDKDGKIVKTENIYLHRMEDNPDSKGEMNHPHSVVRSIDGKLFFVCDKGADLIYSFVVQNGQLVKKGTHRVRPGSAPRYMCTHRTEKYLFVNYELRTEVSLFKYDDDGMLTELDTVSAISEKDTYEERQEASDLKLHPNGNVLYNLIRGNNQVSVIAVDEACGKLKTIQNVLYKASPACIDGARGCAISPDGKYLFVCVPEGTIHQFSIREDGCLTEEKVIEDHHPANILFVNSEQV